MTDCYDRALPDEPRFTLLARDPDFARLVTAWAERRARDIECGDRPISDSALVHEAHVLAKVGAVWRRTNMGRWRK